MIKVGLISMTMLLLVACNDAEPAATSYKKSMAAGKPTGANPVGTGATGTTGTTGTADPAALKAQGTTIYNAKCQTCHAALATSAKKNATATRIDAAKTNANHTGFTYPTPDESKALEAALKG